MSLKTNVIANYLGQGWATLMGLAFIPIYIKHLGIEAYGLIGVFILLQTLLSLLDLGMTPTVSREMARFKGGAHNAKSIRNLLRTIETIALGIAALIAIGVWAASDWLASDWLKTGELSVNTVSNAFSIMGLIVAIRIIENIYKSSLVGLQKQVILNIVISIMATLRGLGAVAVLIWVSPSIEAFFIWQGFLAIITVSMLGMIIYSSLPKVNYTGRFLISSLKEIKQFAGGMLAITFLALLLTQADKIILSRLLTLEAFGYYSFAAIVAGVVYLLTTPITLAYFPLFSELVTRNEEKTLIREYHKSAQLVSVIVGSAAVTLAIFSESILSLWTQDPELARRSARLLALLAFGNMLNALMWIPYQTQLAHGWTSLTLKINLVCVVILVPVIIYVVPLYGAVGAAWVWVLLNAGYVLIGIHFMFRKLLLGEKWRWYIQDVFLPLGAGAITGLVFLWLTPSDMSTWVEVVWLLISGGCIFTACVFTASEFRIKLLSFLKYFKGINKLI